MENWLTTMTALACLRCHRKTAYTGLTYTTEAYCLTALKTGSHFQQWSYLEETLSNCQTATAFLPSRQRGGQDRETDSSIFFYDLPPAMLFYVRLRLCFNSLRKIWISKYRKNRAKTPIYQFGWQGGSIHSSVLTWNLIPGKPLSRLFNASMASWYPCPRSASHSQ